MRKTVKIVGLEPDARDEEIIELDFTDAEWEVLQDFSRYAMDLEGNSLVQEGVPASLKVSWSAVEGLKVETELPVKERINALLVDLRPFLLKGAPTFFPKVRNIMAKASGNQRMRKHLDTLLYLFSGRRLQSIIVTGASSRDYPKGAIINSEEMLEIWLNSDPFHKDKDKQRLFAAMHGLMPPESSIALLLFLIADKVRAILALQRIVSLLSGERDRIFVEVILENPIRYRAFLHATVAQFSLFGLDEEVPALPQEGGPLTRVFDLTHLGPAMFHQFLDVVGQLWMHGQMVHEIGERHYFFRVARGFSTEDGRVHERGADLIATVKVVAFMVEDSLSRARRKPAETLLERMRAEREGKTEPTRVTLKPIETREELDRILDRDPKPAVEWAVVPRIAFMFAYWPISKGARERFHGIVAEGGVPTFENVEGTDIFRAWEILEDEGDAK